MRKNLLWIAVAMYVSIAAMSPSMVIGEDESSLLDERPGDVPSSDGLLSSSDGERYISGFQGFEVLLAFVAVIIIIWVIRRFARRE